MGGQDNGLTLEGLAKRLEALERENERIRFENAELRHKVATLESSGTRRGAVPALRGSGPRPEIEAGSSESDALVSRRSLLSKAGAAAAGLVVAGALTQRDIREAKAAPGAFSSDTDTPAVWATNSSSSAGTGVQGESLNGFGVFGTGVTGVFGHTDDSDHSGVYGQHTGSLGYGIIGDGKGATGAGALGRNGSGSGVRGEGNNGVHGKATGGYGGLLEGGKAQLRLVPKGTTGKPTGAHTKGEIYMDSAAALFVCTKGGTPGTWRKVTTTAV
jgi:hypothetical protein